MFVGFYFEGVDAVFLGAFAWLQQYTHKVWASAVGFALIEGLFWTHDHVSLRGGLICAALVFPLAFGYFHLLNKVEGENTWWILLILGGAVLIVVRRS